MSCLQCLLTIVGDSTAVSQCQNTYDSESMIITLMIFFSNIYIVYAQDCDSAGHMVPNFTCASGSSGDGGISSMSGGDSSTGLGATSSTLITPTQSSIPTSSDSSSSDGEGGSGTATDGAMQSPMSRIMVLIGVIAIAVNIA